MALSGLGYPLQAFNCLRQCHTDVIPLCDDDLQIVVTGLTVTSGKFVLSFRFNLLLFILLLVRTASGAQDFYESIGDSAERSDALKGYTKGSFLAVPIPVSNPTVGTGLQTALLYLHGKAAEDNTPNATSGLAAMYTDNETWLFGAFHDNYLFDDKLRLLAVAGTGDINLDYYGSRPESIFKDRPIGYSVKGDLALVQLLGKIPGTDHWYGGFKASYFGSNVEFDFTEFISFLPKIDLDLDIITLTAITKYDSRDDNYYPTVGRLFTLSASRNDERWNSDVEYTKYAGEYTQYFSLDDQHVIATSFDLQQVEGDAPFFLLPGLNMRGFSMNKYKAEAAASAHLEWRYKFKPRWGVMTSFEMGAVGQDLGQLNDSGVISSFGIGLRWQVQKSQKLNLGIDLGISEDDQALYIVIGEKI